MKKIIVRFLTGVTCSALIFGGMPIQSNAAPVAVPETLNLISEGRAAESEAVGDLMNQINELPKAYTVEEDMYSQDVVKLQSLCDSQEASEAIEMVIQYKNIYDCSNFNLPFTVNVNNNASTFHPLEDIEADEKTKTELYDKYEFLRTEIYTLYKRLMQGSIPFEVAIGFDKNLDSESKLKMIQWYCGFLAAFDDYLANNFISDDPEELLEAWSAYRSAFNYSKEHIQELYSQANVGNNALTVKYVYSAKEREEYIKALREVTAGEEGSSSDEEEKEQTPPPTEAPTKKSKEPEKPSDDVPTGIIEEEINPDDAGNEEEPGNEDESGNEEEPGTEDESGNEEGPGTEDESGNEEEPGTEDESGNEEGSGTEDMPETGGETGTGDEPGNEEGSGTEDEPGTGGETGAEDEPENEDEPEGTSPDSMPVDTE